MQLPSSWGLGQSEIHSSLPVTLGLVSLLFLSLSFYREGFVELRTLSITLPIVWVVSLAVRLAAQQLAIGKFSEYAETVIGPSGNLRMDYEYLPSRAVFAYSITGQLVSLGLISLGLMVVAAMSPTPGSSLTAHELFDLKGGWESRAWASQIMWLNVFLFGLHLLPTVPFDMRATIVAFFGMRSYNAQEPHVLRSVAAFDSHLAAFLFGGGICAACIQLSLGQEILGWYAAVAAAVYLFVASQWEAARAEELEEEYSPAPMLLARQDEEGNKSGPHLDFGAGAAESPDAIEDFAAGARDSAEDILGELESKNEAVQSSTADIDEILRKLHRSGSDSLTVEERQALISASRQIQASRDIKRQVK